jgi:energy-converting hydrogenase Eha subunit A
MFAFILRRLFQAMIVMTTVAFIAFLLFQYVGDPVVFLLGQDATPEQIRALRADLGLDQPFFVQFWHFLSNAVQGEFGLSLRQGAKVSRLIAERFPATMELATIAAVLALALGIPMGVYSALRRGSFMSQVFMTPVAARGLVAHLPDRHLADPVVFGGAGLVSQLRSRGDGPAGLVEQRLADPGWLAPCDPARGHAGDFPAHPDHATGARRDARSAAHRLHQVRTGPRPVRSRHSFRPCAEEHAGSGDDDHRAADSAA